MPKRGVRTAAGVVGVVLVSSGGCGLEQLPPHHPMPPGTGHDIAFRCRSDAPAPTRPQSIFDWDDALANWPNRDGVFADARPIPSPTVRAHDVVPHWTKAQSDEFPTSNLARRDSLVPIGGDYWWQTSYPIAPGRWVSSGFAQKQGDPKPAVVRNQTGWIWKAFTIDGDSLRVAVGGDDDPAVGIELLVEPKDGDDLSKCDTHAPQPPAVGRPALKGREKYTSVYLRRGHGAETVVPYDLDTNTTACPLKGRNAVLRVFDLAAAPHLNVGDIEVSAAPARRTPVWGVGDFHTHPTSYLGFGGLQGMHALWGVPGGSITRYRDPKSVAAKVNISRDIPGCDDGHKRYNGHHGGFAAPLMINVSENRSSEDLKDLALPIMADNHRSQGGPTFKDFPDFRRGAHQQYHITQIHRAYMGGLRLMTSLALQNQGLEYGMGWVQCNADGRPTVQVADDMTLIRAHVEAMRQLAEANHDWMEIAHSPADARRIIGDNKLAVVLGVEVDRLGQTEDVKKEIDELERLGVRQVVVIHAVDNMLGGPAVFNDLYNSVNDWFNREPKRRDWVQALSGELDLKHRVPETFFSITTDTFTTDPDYEHILLRLGNPRRIVLSDAFPHPGPLTHKIGPIQYGVLHPFVNATPIWDKVRGFYDGYGAGHRNLRGLTERGAEYEALLMQHGMLIDVAHMSDAAVQGTLDAEHKHQCDGYPLMISHAHFRKLSVARDDSDRGTGVILATNDVVRPIMTEGLKHHIDNPMSACIQDHTKCDEKVLREATRASHQDPWGPGTVSTGNLPREYDIPTNEVKAVGKRGGVIGVFLAQGMLDSSSMTLPFADDCAGSSKGFATSLLFAEQAMRGGGVGIATDFAFTRSVTPRFGVDACAGYLDAGSGSGAGAQLLETLINPGQYQFAAQRTRVAYGTGGANEPLDPYVMGERTFDFNEDGLSHMGLVPDMLQDVANVLGDARDSALDPLFGSAEAYIEMWERARAKAGCDDKSPLCAAPGTLADRDPQACGNACPNAWNGGAPLQSVDEHYGVCRTGKPITMLGVDDHGKPISIKPVWAQHGIDLHHTTDVDLSKQGDWAVFPIRTRQLWMCGGSGPISLDCPPAANYVKVRRVLELTLGELESCNWEPVPPAVGNQRVVFQCLMGPPEGTP